MKTITILISMLTVLVFNVNGQNKDVKGLLDNQETRTEIFNAIAGDHELMMDFMQVAKENEHGAMMMRNAENHQMKKMESKEGGMMGMNDEHQMMGMMKENPEMMQKMMGNMMAMCKQDSAIYTKMADMMTDSPEMMEMCMKMMSDKKEMNTNSSSSEKESEQKAKNNKNRPRYRHR